MINEATTNRKPYNSFSQPPCLAGQPEPEATTLKCYVLATRRDTLEESDARIAKALHELEQSPRGRRTLNDLQLLLSADAKGLDSSGLEALATLVLEFASGRRTMI